MKYILTLIIMLLAGSAFGALTPIARTDVVPHQRIDYGTTFNFGVIAFHKEGIDRVVFTISGQGYSGGTKTSSSMTYNARTDVWEYWVPIASSEFTSSGTITVTPVAYGNDGGTRNIGATVLVVDHDGNLAQPTAWVSSSGNNGTGQLDNRNLPFQTMGGAVSAIQAVNGGRSDGAIIYFMPGTYSFGSGSTSTLNEWLTLTHDPTSGTKENTIFTSSGDAIVTKLLKIDGLTLESLGKWSYVIRSTTTNLWVDDSRIIGPNRWTEGSNPVERGDGRYYTDTYIYDVDRAVLPGNVIDLARGLTIEHIGEDAFQNFKFIVNCTLTDQDPGGTYAHADAYQSHGSGPNNLIIYNYHVTDAHYQGLFMRATTSKAHNVAIVNTFVEMREPGRKGSATGNVVLQSGATYGLWDHLVFWHNTFVYTLFRIGVNDSSGAGYINSSFIGNYFFGASNPEVNHTIEPPDSLPGNTQNNDFLYNHYMMSATDDPECQVWQTPSGCPWFQTKSPDSGNPATQSVGPRGSVTSDFLNIFAPLSGINFGEPLPGTILIDRLPFATVPADVHGNLRDDSPDVGAIEIQSATCDNTASLCLTQIACEAAQGDWWWDTANEECLTSGPGTPINGSCGSNHGGTLPSLSSDNTDNCATGNVSSFSAVTGGWTWDCSGIDDGTTASCSATYVDLTPPCADDAGECANSEDCSTYYPAHNWCPTINSCQYSACPGGGTGRSPYSATARAPYSATKFARYYEATP